MIGAVIRTKMILHGGLCMLFCYAYIMAVGELAGHKAEHLQIHHVVDDNGVLPVTATFPRFYDT